jgi:hypothetical protein
MAELHVHMQPGTTLVVHLENGHELMRVEASTPAVTPPVARLPRPTIGPHPRAEKRQDDLDGIINGILDQGRGRVQVPAYVTVASLRDRIRSLASERGKRVATGAYTTKTGARAGTKWIRITVGH